MLLRRLSSAAPARQKSGAGILDLIAQLDAGGAITGGTYVSEAMALRQATVFTCVKIISESVASLPIGLYRKTPQHELVEVTDHPALELIARPNNWMTWHELCQYWVTHSELRGNAYAFKVRTGDGRVRELYPLRPDQVGVRQDYDWSLKYTVGAGKENINGTYGPERVFHLRNFGTTGYVGESTIALARDEIGLGLQMQKHASNLFKNGTNIGTVFLHPKTLSDPAYQRLKESIDKNFSGPKNTGRPFIAEEGMTVEKLGMTLEDAQFLDSRRFSKQEIAGLFGVPMFLLNDTEKSTTWGSGLEQIGRAFLNFSLGPRLDRICDTLARELLNDKERRDHVFAFDTDQITLGDFASRMSGYKTAIAARVMKPNEARRRENMNPYPGGDEFPNIAPDPDPKAPKDPSDKPENAP